MGRKVAHLNQKLGKILASKFPLERFSLVLPVVLKIQEAFGDGVKVREVVRGEHLALHDRKINFDLVKPVA